MLRINTLSLHVAMVLSFGLMSCGPKEKPDRDTYRAPAPRILKGGQSVALSGWDQSSQRNLDIHDALDLRNSGSTQVEIVSACRRNGIDTQKTIKTSEQAPTPFFQTLSDELLVADLREQAAICGFKIILINGHGSQHIFNIANVTIGDDSNAQAVFEQRTRRITETRTRFRQSALDGITFRSPLAGTSAALICQDGFAPKMPAGAVGALADFDLNSMTLREGRAADILQSSVQLCRITFSQAELVRAVTPLFELQFNREPLTIKVLAQTNRNDMGRILDFPSDPLLAALRGFPISVATYAVENPSNFSRNIRLPNLRMNVQISIIMVDGAPRLIHTITRPYLSIHPEGLNSEMKLEPRSQLQLNVVFQASGDMRCNPKPTVPNLVLDFPQPLTVEELGAKGEVLVTLTADLGPRLYVNTNAAAINSVPATPVANICQW